jgi:hypothetical protein
VVKFSPRPFRNENFNICNASISSLLIRFHRAVVVSFADEKTCSEGTADPWTTVRMRLFNAITYVYLPIGQNASANLCITQISLNLSLQTLGPSAIASYAHAQQIISPVGTASRGICNCRRIVGAIILKLNIRVTYP